MSNFKHLKYFPWFYSIYDSSRTNVLTGKVQIATKMNVINRKGNTETFILWKDIF